jgi:hypothetical protein
MFDINTLKTELQNLGVSVHSDTPTPVMQVANPSGILNVYVKTYKVTDNLSLKQIAAILAENVSNFAFYRTTNSAEFTTGNPKPNVYTILHYLTW